MGYVPSITYNIPKQPYQVFYRIHVLRSFAKFEENTFPAFFYSKAADSLVFCEC